MTYYIGIDLGTTNSAISVYDGENVRVYKSRQGQSDVTPSNIYIDKNGKQFCGQRAYSQLGNQADRVAKQFKRFMGTSTDIEFAGKSMTPVECSAEILKELMRCLPEEISTSEDKATVITVPAAFDQRQNSATEEAAKLANIGKVALMQEPVAAIVRAVKDSNKNGSFIVFDIGGGTLDVAIATCFSGKVDIVAHGGIAMCGGADMDMRIVDNIVIPWIQDNYNVPNPMRGIKKYEKMLKLARFHSEQAKIELSSSEDADIYGSLRGTDEDDEEIELDINISREKYNPLIEDLIDEAIEATRETIKKSGIEVSDFDKVIFIGGPSNYKYLRDRVVRELGIKSDALDINPMTAVSEGAAIFAESIDWSTDIHSRKSNYSEVATSEDLGLNFKYDSRTTSNEARIGLRLKKQVKGYTFQICSVDSGWDSGMLNVENGKMIAVPLSKMGENKFDVFVFDEYSRKVSLNEDRIVIVHTNANVGSILASHSIGVEVKESAFSDSISLDFLVKEGDKLPVKGTKTYKATETIKAGSSNAISIKMWEGEITDNITDNRYIGCMRIEGSDLEYGSIKSGADLIFSYTITEAGTVNVDVTIPSLDEIMFNSGKNFYAHNDEQIDMNDSDTIDNIANDGENILNKASNYSETIDDDRLEKVEKFAQDAINLRNQAVVEPEVVKKNSDNLFQAKILLDKIRHDNLLAMRKKELADARERYDKYVESLASTLEKQQLSDMFKTAEKVIERNEKSFENIIDDIRSKCTLILFEKDDGYVIDMFKYYRYHKEFFVDKKAAQTLFDEGTRAIENGEYKKLRNVIINMFPIMRNDRDVEGINDISNIMRG